MECRPETVAFLELSKGIFGGLGLRWGLGARNGAVFHNWSPIWFARIEYDGMLFFNVGPLVFGFARAPYRFQESPTGKGQP